MSDEDNNKDVWYFAIGSMMLPASYKEREFYPKKSVGGELFDYRMNFFGSSGVAEAFPSPGESMHGVLHRVTMEQMIELDKIELGYIRQTGKARAYDNPEENIEVTVYCRPASAREKSEEDKPPTERYIGILIAGAKHYNIDEGYIHFLENHPYQPRPVPDEFQPIGEIPESSAHYKEIPKEEDLNEGKLYFTLNGKMLEYTEPKDSFFYNFMKDARDKYGPHLEILMARVQFDLKYGTPSTLGQFTREHSAYVEHLNYVFMQKSGKNSFKIIGTFEQCWVD